MGEELLVVKKDKGNDKIKFKVVEKRFNSWVTPRYQKILSNKDYHNLALLLYDLNNMGYPIHRAYARLKELTSDPELFFL